MIKVRIDFTPEKSLRGVVSVTKKSEDRRDEEYMTSKCEFGFGNQG